MTQYADKVANVVWSILSEAKEYIAFAKDGVDFPTGGLEEW